MLTINTLETLHTVVEKEKNKYMQDLSVCTASIAAKQKLIDKMSQYIKDYDNQINLSKVHVVPGLYKNYFSFVDQIKKSLAIAECEIENIRKSADILYKKMILLDQKLSYISEQKQKVIKAQKKSQEKKEFQMLDDRAANQFGRR